MYAAAALPSPSAPPQLYRQFFTAAECTMLDSSPLESALSEISLLRILLMRLLAASRRLRSLPIKRHLSMLAAIGHAGLIMASLARFHAKQASHSDPFLDALALMDPEDL